MQDFNNIEEVFIILNQNNVPYLVLRNYENMLNAEMYVDGHGDIDILCEDSQTIAKLLHCKTNRKDINGLIGDGTHYYIYIQGKYVSLDLRHIGDNYYCEKWEYDLLSRREKYKFFYIPNKMDYFFSLLYHAVLQKRHLSDDYKDRLLQMAQKLNIQLGQASEKEFINQLNIYMKQNGYTYTYSKDIVVPNRFELVDKSLVERNTNLRYRHWFFDTKIKFIETAVRIKHFMEGKK